jgi:hypothetical protein
MSTSRVLGTRKLRYSEIREVIFALLPDCQLHETFRDARIGRNGLIISSSDRHETTQIDVSLLALDAILRSSGYPESRL